MKTVSYAALLHCRSADGAAMSTEAMGKGRQARGSVVGGRNWAGRQIQNDPEMRRHQKSLFACGAA